MGALNERLRALAKKIVLGDDLPSLAGNGFSVAEAPKDRLAFFNCRVYDGVKPVLHENRTVLVCGEKIQDILAGAETCIPENFAPIDAGGQTLMPGLIDGHIHLCSPFTYRLNLAAVREMREQIALNNRLTVHAGVTTVCDMGGPHGLIREFTRLADRNDIPGPRYLNCFTLISPGTRKRRGYPAQVKSLDPCSAWLLEGQVATRPKTRRELLNVCHRVRDEGGVHLKATFQSQPFSRKKPASPDDFPVFDPDWMKTILAAGRESGLTVDVHAPYAEDAGTVVDLAIEVGAAIRIQHMTFDRELAPEFLRKMRDYGFYLLPTVTIYGDSFHLPHFLGWLNTGAGSRMMPEAIRQSRANIEHGIGMEPFSGRRVLGHDHVYFRENFDIVRRNTQKAHAAGVIGFGTDLGGTPTGFFGRICAEIGHYADFGISAPDLLRYLTSGNAGIYGLGDRGEIGAGKLADLILVDGNPLEDPATVLGKVSAVMKGGVFLKFDERKGPK